MLTPPRWLFGCCSLLVVACGSGDGAPPAQPPAQRRQEGTPKPPPTLVHDFGTIRHGESRQHDFVLDVRAALGPGWYSPGTHVDCSCARTELWMRAKDGSERPVEVYSPNNAPKEGEVLVVRTTLDTIKREPVDTKVLESRVVVVLQHSEARDPNQRVPWQLQFRFQVDSPVRVRPVSIIDFGRVAPSQPAEQTLTLSSDLGGRTLTFRNARVDDERLQVALEPSEGFTLLRVRFAPRVGDGDSLRALVQVDTDLDPPYHVHLAATATLVPDLEVIPFAKISLRADLRQAQPTERASSQYVLVTDHDTSRVPGFVVAKILDDNGQDASRQFEVTLEPVADEPRSCRVHVRWTGASTTEFRGKLVLAKDPTNGPFLPIELVALHDTRP
jgi:hypothetical protein